MSDGSNEKVFKALRDTGVRLIIGAVMALAFSGWCFRDGYLVNWKISDHKFVKAKDGEVVDVTDEIDIESTDGAVEIDETITATVHTPGPMYKQYSSDFWKAENVNLIGMFVFNVVGAWILLVVGVVLLIMAARALKRTATVDDAGISINGAPAIAWSEITGLDASLLEKKGKLSLLRGDSEPLVLNRYHYADFRDLVAFIEDHVKTS